MSVLINPYAHGSAAWPYHDTFGNVLLTSETAFSANFNTYQGDEGTTVSPLTGTSSIIHIDANADIDDNGICLGTATNEGALIDDDAAFNLSGGNLCCYEFLFWLENLLSADQTGIAQWSTDRAFLMQVEADETLRFLHSWTGTGTDLDLDTELDEIIGINTLYYFCLMWDRGKTPTSNNAYRAWFGEAGKALDVSQVWSSTSNVNLPNNSALDVRVGLNNDVRIKSFRCMIGSGNANVPGVSGTFTAPTQFLH